MAAYRVNRRHFVTGAFLLTAAALAACSKAPEPTSPAAGESAPAAGADPFASISNGSGAVITLNGKKVAIYKDANGQVAQLSPACPHAGCEVAWNASESTWDCPCHRSRFEPTGARITGPAPSGLASAS